MNKKQLVLLIISITFVIILFLPINSSIQPITYVPREGMIYDSNGCEYVADRYEDVCVLGKPVYLDKIAVSTNLFSEIFDP